MEYPEPLPCPFCAWTHIRVIEDEIIDEQHLLFGSKYTYCWCKVCCAKGPSAYSVDDEDEDIFKKCIERWNERNEKKGMASMP